MHVKGVLIAPGSSSKELLGKYTDESIFETKDGEEFEIITGGKGLVEYSDLVGSYFPHLTMDTLPGSPDVHSLALHVWLFDIEFVR